jgi:hypothetical protein
VTVQRIQYEEREEQIPVKVCKMVTEERVVQEPRTVAKWVATDGTRMTPRVVAMKVPVDACGNIETTYMPAAEGTTTRRVIIDPTPRVEVQRPTTPAPMPPAPATETQRPMVDEETSETPSADEAQREAEKATNGNSIKKEPDTKVVPQAPKEPTDKDPTGTPSLNGPNRAKKEPTPADSEA